LSILIFVSLHPTLYDKSDDKIQISKIVMADRPNLGLIDR